MSSSPPTRADFLRSRFYLCALAYNKKNEERLNNIRELLEKVDLKKKHSSSQSAKKPRSNWTLPESSGDTQNQGSNSQEDTAILSADKEGSIWVFDNEKDYVLTLGGVEVMKVPKGMFERLKPFQRDAVRWFGGIAPVGGILADDMGMGKTFMTISSLGARMRVGRLQMALVVAPISVLATWEEEGKKFLPQFAQQVRIQTVYKGTEKERRSIIRNAWKNSSPTQPYIIVTSWGLAGGRESHVTFKAPSGRNWDYVVFDEAHELKNHLSNRAKCCRAISHKRGTSRLLLTGTPFQNDTDEIWSLVNMATAGQVLGKIKQFNIDFGKLIKNARNRSATRYVVQQGEAASTALQEKLQPYLLRRLKVDHLMEELPSKIETCVWVRPSQQQTQMYKDKVQSKSFTAVAETLKGSDKEAAREAMKNAFQLLSVLKNICFHPLLLQKGGPEGTIVSALEQTDLKTILNGSRKLELAVHMLKSFKGNGHKTLLFSQSTQNLDIIHYVLLKMQSFTIARIDGTVSQTKRKATVKLFEQGKFDLLLVTTGAGGVGLTLNRASRVIMYDPAWNPSKDAQAADRSYRIGQTKEVRVYRLFTAGSVEEKVYERQIHKTGLEKTLFTKASTSVKSLFDKDELCKIFAQVPDGSCKLLERFKQEGIAQVAHAERTIVHAHPSVIGISNHHGIYRSKRKNAFDEAANIDAKRLKEATGTMEPVGASVKAAEPPIIDSDGNATP